MDEHGWGGWAGDDPQPPEETVDLSGITDSGLGEVDPADLGGLGYRGDGDELAGYLDEDDRGGDDTVPVAAPIGYGDVSAGAEPGEVDAGADGFGAAEPDGGEQAEVDGGDVGAVPAEPDPGGGRDGFGAADPPVGSDPDAWPAADADAGDLPQFPPELDLAVPEPVDGLPWTDPDTLGAGSLPDPADPAGAADQSPSAEELFGYAGEQPPEDGADMWATLAASEDPATSALARWWAPDR